MVLSVELLNRFIDQMQTNETTAIDNYAFAMSPKMHKCFYLLNGLQYVDNHATHPMRKVHLRKIVARRKARKRQLERIYQRKYGAR